VHFLSFDLKCEASKVHLRWKTADEQNSSHFQIERSIDGIHWTMIGNRQAAGNSNTERSYSFTDDHPEQNSLYRVSEYDIDGNAHYSELRRSSCIPDVTFSLWPNPVHDHTSINFVASSESKATIKLLDSKGSVIKIKTARVFQGSNQLNIDMNLLPNGIYVLLIDWHNGQNHKAVQLLKQ
jgi:hypothetical protein